MGDGILDCKNLEEIKMRNEMENKCAKLLAHHDTLLYDEFQRLITASKAEIEADGFTEELCANTEADVERKYKVKYDCILLYFKDIVRVKIHVEMSLLEPLTLNSTLLNGKAVMSVI